MTTTRAQLAIDTLIDLNIIPAEGSPRPADSALVVARLNALLAEKTLADMVYWSADAIPDAVYLPLLRMLGVTVKGAFGRPVAVDEEAAALRLLRARLRETSHVESSNVPTESSDF